MTREILECCGYCGLKGHGANAPGKIRKNECPAYGNQCDRCLKPNHFPQVCRGAKLNPRRQNTFSETAATFNALCTITDSCSISDEGIVTSLRLDHHAYDKLSDTWVKRKSKPQPTTNVVARVVKEDYTALGFEHANRPLSAVLPALADTGCQSCLAGINVIKRLGLRVADLIPVTMSMHTATYIGIKIIGATVLRLNTAEGDRAAESRQMTYVTDSCDKLFLSRKACTELGILLASFPNAITNPIQNATIQQQICSCPKRQLPPPPHRQNALPRKQRQSPSLEGISFEPLQVQHL